MFGASDKFLKSFWIRGSTIGWNFLNLCCNVFNPSLMGMSCWIIRVSYVFKSSYVHANKPLYFLNKQMIFYHSDGEQHVPRFTNFRSSWVPKLTCSYDNFELWNLVLIGPLNQFFRSSNISMDITPLGKLLSFTPLDASYKSLSCSSSTMVTSLNISTLTMKRSICWY